MSNRSMCGIVRRFDSGAAVVHTGYSCMRIRTSSQLPLESAVVIRVNKDMTPRIVRIATGKEAEDIRRYVGPW